MAKSVLELAVGTGQWDAGLKKAKNALDNFTQANGGLQSALNKDSKSMQTFVQMMGRMDSTAKTAKGQMNDYKGTIEQLTMQYNRLTDAQKKTIGQDYLRSIDQMKQKYQGVAQEVAKINQELKQTNEMSAGTGSGGGGLFSGDKLSGMLQVFGGNVMTKVAGMGVGLVSELGDMVKQGIELARAGEGIRIAFERLNKPGLLDNLREATHGTVTDLELMKAAVKFNDFKLPVEELGTMLAFAQQKAKDTGQSVDYMVDSIVTGLGRKSLMILDNLGLSATEIRDKMKETGDMTKAVGEIIREQMAKAGDYVETAADRATKANVELKNAMTRLGETFQPLTDAANDMWTGIKVGALDLLNNVLKPLIDKFTELGRMRAVYEGQGGDTRVNRQLDRLKGIQSDSYRQGTYKAQLRNYDTQIASHEQYLKDYKAWQSDNTNVGAYDRMQKFKQQTGLEWVSDVQAHLDAFKKMRSEYVQGAKSILAANPVPSPTSTTTTTPTGGASGNTSTTTTKQPKTEIEQNQAKIKDLTQEYIKLGDQETEASKNRQIEIQKEIELLQKRNNLIGVRTEQAQGKLMGGDVQHLEYKHLPYIIDRSHLFDTEGGIGWQKLQKYNDQTSVSEYKWRKQENEKEDKQNKDGKETKKLTDKLSTLASGLSSIAGGLKSMGIDLPKEVDQVIGVIQGVTSVIEGVNAIISLFSSTTMASNTIALGLNTAALWAVAATNFFPFANGGVVHAADGTVAGNTYSGDQIPAMLNAGELVLNKAQQGNLASQLEGGVGAMQLSAIITGEQLRLVLNNNGRRTGRGEYVTTNFR